jgi:hypothetical protein
MEDSNAAPSPPSHPKRIHRYVGPIVILIFGLVMLALTTRRLPNAATMLNIVVLAVILALTYKLFLQIASPLAATVGCLVFLGIFAFGQYTTGDGHNFITPRSRGLILGLLLSLLAITLLHRYGTRLNPFVLVTTSAVTGLLLLTQSSGFRSSSPAHAEDLLLMLKSIAVYLLLLGPFIAALWVRRHRAPWAVLIATFVCATILTMLLSIAVIDWTQIARPLPLLMFLAMIAAAVDVYRNGRAPQRILRLSLILFSLICLSTTILNARVSDEGFVLALPASLILIAILVAWIPAFIERKHGDPNIFIAAVLGVILVAVAIHIRVTLSYARSTSAPRATLSPPPP